MNGRKEGLNVSGNEVELCVVSVSVGVVFGCVRLVLVKVNRLWWLRVLNELVNLFVFLVSSVVVMYRVVDGVCVVFGKVVGGNGLVVSLGSCLVRVVNMCLLLYKRDGVFLFCGFWRSLVKVLRLS